MQNPTRRARHLRRHQKEQLYGAQAGKGRHTRLKDHDLVPDYKRESRRFLYERLPQRACEDVLSFFLLRER